MFQKREHNKRKEIDLWPQLLAKGLCKSIMNYERLLGQPIHQLLRMLTGMPVREYSNDVLSFEVLRNSFTRNNPTLAKASPEFIRLINNSSSILHGSNQTKLQNWVVYHVISFTSEEDAWVEVGHPHCLNLNPKSKYTPPANDQDGKLEKTSSSMMTGSSIRDLRGSQGPPSGSSSITLGNTSRVPPSVGTRRL